MNFHFITANIKPIIVGTILGVSLVYGLVPIERQLIRIDRKLDVAMKIERQLRTIEVMLPMKKLQPPKTVKIHYAPLPKRKPTFIPVSYSRS